MFHPLKSTIIIVVFFTLNALVAWGVWNHRGKEDWGKDSSAILSETPSVMGELHYFYLEHGRPSLSLAADTMHSLGEESASFVRPRGTYTSDAQSAALSYQAQAAEYVKKLGSLRLTGDVQMEQERSRYQAQELTYYHRKDLLYGKGGVDVQHITEKSAQTITVKAQAMKARPKARWANFQGQVDGLVKPKLKFQDPLYLQSNELELKGLEGVLTLKENVRFRRADMRVTARNGDIFLEQANKKLKYFILNDDVKVTESLLDAQGRPMTRQAFAERMEGFGQDRVVLSGAPRVLQGKDVIKGYRITLREQMEFIEVEDAMSDVKVQKDEDKKAKER